MQKITLCLIFAWYAGLLAGQSVVLDTTFGAGGLVLTDLKDRNYNPYGDNMVALPDGEVVVVGDLGWDSLVVKKYSLNGINELSFTTGLANLSSYQSSASGQKDKKIIVSGTQSIPPYHTNIARLNVDGGLDTTFGMSGISSVFLDYIYVSNLFEQSNGKIISFGCERLNNGNPPTVVTRLNSDGSIDSTFGTDGTFRQDIINGYEFIPAGLEQPDGKLLFVGMADWTILMLRLNPNGQIDSTFGLFGILEDPIGGRDVLCEAYDLILLPDGKITVTGYTRNPWAAVVVQYNSDGTHDTSFGIQGIHYFPGILEGVSIVGRSDGKIIAALTGQDTLGYFTELGQLLPNGERDSSFGVHGIFRLQEPNLRARALLLNGNKLTLSGRNESSDQIILFRFLLDLSVGILDPKVKLDAIPWVYPNPIDEQFTLKFELAQKEQVSIQLFDLNGKLVQSFVQNHSFDQGEQELTLSCGNHLAVGNYILTLEVAGKKASSIQIMKK